ncbi:MAG: EamA family transporter [Candidatus Omnitrophica bacterium]|nr:EamA family transporter [Candidatus Omnitrophota bacterium]
MFKKSRVTFKILFFLVSVDALETVTQLCFKKSVIGHMGFQVDSLTNAALFLKYAVLSPYLWFGLTSVILTFVIWSTILSKIDLSVAVPVCSFSYVFIPLASMFFFKEQINFLRWSGIVSILIGVILVSLSSGHKEGAS